MPFKKFRLKTSWLFIALLLLSITACDPFLTTTDLEKIQRNDAIVMGTVNSSLTYSFDSSQYSGFDYELGKKFAAYLNVELKVKEYDTLQLLFHALNKGKIDFIGAGLTLTPKRAQKYRSSPPYYYVSQKVVYRKGTYRPRKITDVTEPIAVLQDSSHEETLQGLLGEAPDLKILIEKDEDQESLLRKIADKEIKFALVDSTTLAQKQRYYPILTEAFTLSESLPVAWLIKRSRDNTVYSAMVEFIGKKHQDHTITKLQEKYFGHVADFDFVDTKIFLKRIKSILPKYEALFKQYATEEINWQLLAAISYQESHWNPKAKSPTGVRGMMMLTRTTAKSLGVKNRINAQQSIQGGAKYLSKLLNRLPDSIADNEKIWFALASYNLGYGHLMDTRRITSMKGQNQDLWSDVKDNLPLLHQKKWYQKTHYGYARGKEAQHYVNNIRQYHKTLTWLMTERANEQAQQQARLAAKEKALAEQQALTTEEALQQVEQEIQAKQQALQQATTKMQEIERALAQAKEKTLVEDKSLEYATTHAIGLKKALKENSEKSIAAQQAFLASKENILAEQALLQEAETKARAEVNFYQQAKDEAIIAQQAYQEAKNKALAEQQRYQQAKQQALAEQARLQQVQSEEQLVAEKKRAAEKQLAEEKKRAAEKQLAEEKKRAAEKQLAEEKKRAAKKQLAEEKKRAAKKQLAEEKKQAAEEKLVAEKKRAAEKQLATDNIKDAMKATKTTAL